MIKLDYKDYHVLLVDDSRPMLELLSEYLKNGGFKVTAVTDADVALELVDKGEVDVIISDIFMPFTNGLELSRKIKKRIPVILISGVENNGLDGNIAELSDAFLDKSIKQEMLVSAVKKAIDRWKMEHRKS